MLRMILASLIESNIPFYHVPVGIGVMLHQWHVGTMSYE